MQILAPILPPTPAIFLLKRKFIHTLLGNVETSQYWRAQRTMVCSQCWARSNYLQLYGATQIRKVLYFLLFFFFYFIVRLAFNSLLWLYGASQKSCLFMHSCVLAQHYLHCPILAQYSSMSTLKTIKGSPLVIELKYEERIHRPASKNQLMVNYSKKLNYIKF